MWYNLTTIVLDIFCEIDSLFYKRENFMELLKKAILNKGKILPGNVLSVGSFLNCQIDVSLYQAMGKEIFSHFSNCAVNKILTVESSGIGLACITAQFFNCPVVFAKKSHTANVNGNVYSAECYSYTHKKTNNLIVPTEFLTKEDNVLIIDDFLAMGEAVNASIGLIKQAGAKLCGVAIAIEKGFQGGGDKLREQGVNLLSLAIIDKMDDKGIEFRN